MKIAPPSSAKAEFLRLYKTSMNEGMIIEKQDPQRLFNLRCSGIPYCPRSTLRNFKNYRGRFRPASMATSFYTGVGHAVHHTMQTFLSQSGRFLANYTCQVCKKKYPMSYQYECCELPTLYDEVAIDVGRKKYLRIQGHIDGIYKDSKGRLWIVDYKTASVAGAEGKAKNPPKNYMRQVRAYAYLLHKQYGLKVEGCMLVFIPRDNPNTPAIWEHKISTDLSKLREELMIDKRLHKKTMLATTMKELQELSKINCGDEYCKACKMSQTEMKKIFSSLIKSNVLPILKEQE